MKKKHTVAIWSKRGRKAIVRAAEARIAAGDEDLTVPVELRPGLTVEILVRFKDIVACAKEQAA